MTAQNASRLLLHVLQSFGEHHTVRSRFRHHTLSTATRMNLCLHHKPLGSGFFSQGDGGLVRGFRGVCDLAALDGYAKRFEDAFALVFVDVHAKWVV